MSPAVLPSVSSTVLQLITVPYVEVSLEDSTDSRQPKVNFAS